MTEPKYHASKNQWCISVYDGGKRVKTFWSSKQGLAGRREVLAKYNAYMAGGSSTVNITVADELARFLEDYSARVAPDSYVNTKSLIECYIMPKLARKRLASVRVTDWQACINSARKKDGSMLALKSYKKIRATIVQFLKFCQMDGIDVPNGSPLYVPKSAQPVGKEVLSADAIARLFDDNIKEVRDCFYIHFYRFLLLSGMRPGEAVGLMWSDVSADGFVTIRRSINIRDQITPGKNKNAQRRFKLPALAIHELALQRELTADLYSDWIFCRADGNHGRTNYIYKVWHELREIVGAPNTCLYSFRHTYISLAAPSLNLPMLRSIVGHSVNMDTYGTYYHDSDAQLIQAASIMDLTTFKELEKISGK